MLLVGPENETLKKLACAYGNLKVGDLHRTINNAVEFSGTVAIPISPFGGD